MSRIIENPKQLIMDTAKNILYTDGYPKLSMRNIASTCDISIGTIYNYYPTKKDLVVEMMTGYWESFFKLLDEIIGSDNNFYTKLSTIYKELELFIKTFKEVWLKPELYEAPGYVENGLAQQVIYMKSFTKKIEDLLLKEASNANTIINIRFDAHETAGFIVTNLITLIQMPSFTYLTFESFLKEILR